MSITATRTESQASRHGERRHSASIARQRQLIRDNDTEHAMGLVRWLRLALANGAYMPQAKDFNALSEAGWEALMAELTQDEVAVMNTVCTFTGDDLETTLRRQADRRYEKIATTWHDAVDAA